MTPASRSEGRSGPARDWLDAHVNLERGDRLTDPSASVPSPTLDRIQHLVAVLGDPQTAYPVVHVTGTNGKSSTARMTAALLAAKGLSVGLYTSPHLTHVNERLQWNGQWIDDEALDGLLDAIRGVEDLVLEATGRTPTFFEIMTAAAFMWFADNAVDAAVIEVGLGGTWDATNVADATVAVVTNIGIDHVEFLGPTRYGIAKEKAGIVKEGSILILGETDPELAPLFEAGPTPSRIHRRDVDFGVRANTMAHEGRLVTLYAPGGEYDEVFLRAHGAHQADNAACALAAAESFFGYERFEASVAEVAFGGLELPGRLEVVGRHPLVLLDGAHNAEGAEALAASLAEEFPSGGRTLVVGMLRERDPQEMLEALGLLEAERLVVCRPPSPRALDPEALAAAAQRAAMPRAMIDVADSVPEALARALAVTPDDGQVVVTGSLYTVGAARAVLVPR